ncbi:MAG: FlgB family protein [Pseudorhodobacter sp.]
MIEKLEITRMAQAMASYAGARMGIIARNIANADTPGFKARDLPDFARVYASAPDQIKATRPGHFGSVMSGTTPKPMTISGEMAPNGNSVSLEQEMVRMAEVRQQHDMALSIYRSTSNILKTALGRGR